MRKIRFFFYDGLELRSRTLLDQGQYTYNQVIHVHTHVFITSLCVHRQVLNMYYTCIMWHGVCTGRSANIQARPSLHYLGLFRMEMLINLTKTFLNIFINGSEEWLKEVGVLLKSQSWKLFEHICCLLDIGKKYIIDFVFKYLHMLWSIGTK